MFTFNQYTVEFFKNNFMDYAQYDVESLLINPDIPELKSYAIRKNPLAYRYELAHYGFQEIQQEFSILTPMPPLLDPIYIMLIIYIFDRCQKL